MSPLRFVLPLCMALLAGFAAAARALPPDLVLAAVVVTAVLTLVLYALTYLVERVCIPWERAGVVSGA